jgi:hypothetical protein
LWTSFAAALVLGFLLFRSHRSTQQRDDFAKHAVELAKEQNAPPAIAAAVRRAVGEYHLRSTPPNPAEAVKSLSAARDRLANADLLPQERALERLLVLTEIALTQAGLGGSGAEVEDGRRLNWAKVHPEMRKTVTMLPMGGVGQDGVTLAFERLSRALGISGDKVTVATALVGNAYPAQSDEQTDLLATVGLEFFSLGDVGREKATELAGMVRDRLRAGQPRAKAIALHVALDQISQLPNVRPPSEGEPPSEIRFGFAEGFARRGDWEQARKAAQLPGRFEDRFAAQALIAAAGSVGANPDAATAVELLVKELGPRDLPDWPLIRLAQAIARTPGAPSGQALFDFVQGLESLSPRSQAIRAWVQMELVRAGSPQASQAVIESMAPATTAGHAMAWETLGRRLAATGDAPGTVSQCPESLRTRPLALAGIALGLLDSGR